jgi:hypothetical protein
MKNFIIILFQFLVSICHGQQWNTLSDVSLSVNIIHEMKIYNDTLFIAGYFSEINGMESSGIFQWDSTSISLLSDAESVAIHDFVLVEDTIYVVGGFFTANDVLGTRGIAGFSDNEWWSVGGVGKPLQTIPHHASGGTTGCI